MVEELDAQQARGGLHDGNELLVRLARRRIAVGMIMGDDDCIGLDLERLTKSG